MIDYKELYSQELQKTIRLKTENSMLKDKVKKLEESSDGENLTYIYESPDDGNTIYRREVGTDERVLMQGFYDPRIVKWKEVPKNK